VEETCYATKQGFPQSGRENDDANVIFQVGGSRLLRSSQSTQSTPNCKEMNRCVESELLPSLSTNDLSRQGGRPVMQRWTLAPVTAEQATVCDLLATAGPSMKSGE